MELGQEAIDKHFQERLKWGDNVSGTIAGWLQDRIFLREAEVHQSQAVTAQ